VYPQINIRFISEKKQVKIPEKICVYFPGCSKVLEKSQQPLFERQPTSELKNFFINTEAYAVYQVALPSQKLV
jgi:hypothetical protein